MLLHIALQLIRIYSMWKCHDAYDLW